MRRTNVALVWLCACSRSAAPTATTDASVIVATPASASSSAPATPAFSEADLAQPCADLASRHCDDIDAREGIAGTYGTREHCVARHQMICVRDARLAGSGMTPVAIRACAHAVDADTCTYHGALTSTQHCAMDAQCASGACMRARGADCGSCVDLPATPGVRCKEERCGGGLTCVDDICRARGKRGEPCDGSCETGSWCVAGRCVAFRGKGDACDEQRTDIAPCASPLVCSDKHKCELPKPTVYKRIGDRCDRHGDPCRMGLCRPDGNDDDVGRCVALTRDGETCDDTFGDPCELPSRCVDRKCQMPRHVCP